MSASSLAEDYGLNGDAATQQNGKQKKFDIVPSTDPTTLAILKAREDAIKDRRLKGQHAKFIIAIIDRCLHPRHFHDYERGVCCAADSVTSKLVGVSRRTISTYRAHEATAKYIWCSLEPRPDKWPMTKYHLVCLHGPKPQRRTEWRDGGASYAEGGSGRAPLQADAAKRGRDKIFAALKAKRAQATLPLKGGMAVVPTPPPAGEIAPPVGSVRRLKAPKIEVLQAISARARKFFPQTAEAGFCGQQKPASADSGNGLLRSAEADFSGGEKPTSPVSRSGDRRTAEANGSHKETQLRELRASKERGKPPAPEKTFLEAIKERHADLADWLETFNGAYRSKVEKSRERIAAQMRIATPNQKPLLKRKVAALDELLDGPAPPPAEKPGATAKAAKPPPTAEEGAAIAAAMRKAVAEATR
jgi:hypothetical protein